MKKYYYNDGANQGPVTGADLQLLFAAGKISANTHILEVGTKQWVKYKDVFATPEAATSAASPNTQFKAVFNKISKESTRYVETITDFDYNRSIDPLFEKALRLPSFFATEQARATYFTFSANAGSILCWLSVIFYSLATLPSGMGLGANLLTFILSIIAGFFLQKLFYHCYKMTTEALFAKKVELGSLDFPRMGMVMAMLFALLQLLTAILVLFIGNSKKIADFAGGSMSGGLLFLLSLAALFTLLAIFFAHAPKINAVIVKKTLTPGLYFVNMLRYLVNTIALTVQALIPFFLFIYILGIAIPDFDKDEKVPDAEMSSFEIMNSPRYSRHRDFDSFDRYHKEEVSKQDILMPMNGAVFIIPLVNLVFLFGASIPLDVIASLMSNGKQRRREDELSDDDLYK